MPFSKPVHTSWCDADSTMTVEVELTYIDPKGRVWTVPEGFTTDGASIPSALWSLIGSPFTGLYRLPAVFHDAAYGTLGVTKAEADRMFFDAMLEAGVSRVIASAMHAAVKLGGNQPYAEAQRRAAGAPHELS